MTKYLRFILANVPVVRCANPPVQSRQAITVLDDDDKTDDQLMQKTAAWVNRIERLLTICWLQSINTQQNLAGGACKS